MSEKCGDYTLSEPFKKCIRAEIFVEKNNSFSIKENEVSYTFKMPPGQMAGLKIEKQLKVFKQDPICGIPKMCDAIFVVNHEGNDFIIVVEIKTNNRGENYIKQLQNAHRFCQWLVQLLKDHKHYFGAPQYLGILVTQNNPSLSPKNMTTAARAIDYRLIGSMRCYFEIGNEHEVQGVLTEELKHLSKTA